LVGPEGIEPSTRLYKNLVLPLNYGPVSAFYYSHLLIVILSEAKNISFTAFRPTALKSLRLVEMTRLHRLLPLILAQGRNDKGNYLRKKLKRRDKRIETMMAEVIGI
jgi:hypothetical protein